MPENQNASSVKSGGSLPGKIAQFESSGRNGLEHLAGSSLSVVKKIAVGIALKGHTPPESYHDRTLMAYNMGCREVEDAYLHKSLRYEFLWLTAGEIFIPFAREQLANHALIFNCDYLFMIDDDQLADPDLVFRLAAHNVDVVGALTFTRNAPHNPVIYEKVEGFDPSCGKDYSFVRQVQSYPRNTLVECDAVGFGAVLIKTDLFRKMPAPWFMGSHGTGEDIHFCLEARKHGFRVYMDTSQKMGHLTKPLVVTEEYADKVQGMDEAERERLYGRFQKYPTFERVK